MAAKKEKEVFELMHGQSLDIKKLGVSPSRPALLSKKLDGIQAFTWDSITAKTNGLEVTGTVLTRRWKPVPNAFIRSILSALPRGFQGELTVKPSNSLEGFQVVTSGVMSRDGEPDFIFTIFNYFGDGSKAYCALPLKDRLRDALAIVIGLGLTDRVRFIEYKVLDNIEDINAQVEAWVAEGEEGGMITFGDVPYYWGRANKTNPYLAKVKPFKDTEWHAIGFEAETYGPTETNFALGVVGQKKDQLGKIRFGPENGFAEGFTAACKFSDAMAQYIWLNQEKFLGQPFTVKYLACGCKDRPRHPNVLHPKDELLYLEMIKYAQNHDGEILPLDDE